MDYKDKYIKYKIKYLELQKSEMINQTGGRGKILFIMFQGSSTNLKTWNEYTKSKFLDKLRKLGEIYLYQDKTYNIWFYDKTNDERKDFDSDIDFDLSYVNLDHHIKNIFNDIKTKYVDYKLVPIGWSAGAYLAYYFAQKYHRYCKLCVLLDPCGITPKNINLRLKDLYNDIENIYPITNNNFKLMLEKWKIDSNDKEDAYKLLYLTLYIRTLFIRNKLNLKLPVRTISFVNIQKPEKSEYSLEFNNETRLREIEILKNKNPQNFSAYIFENKTHYIFNEKQPAKKIISVIRDNIC